MVTEQSLLREVDGNLLCGSNISQQHELEQITRISIRVSIRNEFR